MNESQLLLLLIISLNVQAAVTLFSIHKECSSVFSAKEDDEITNRISYPGCQSLNEELS